MAFHASSAFSKRTCKAMAEGGYLWESGRPMDASLFVLLVFLLVLEISWNTTLWFHTDEIFFRNPLYYNFLMIMRSNSPTKIYVLKRVDSFFFLGRQGRSFESTGFRVLLALHLSHHLHGWIRRSSYFQFFVKSYVFLGNIHQSTIISHLFPKKNHAL